MATKTKARTNGAKEAPAEEGGLVTVAAPRMKVAVTRITGTAPLMVHRFSKKAELQRRHEEGSVKAAGKKAKPPRDFEADYQAARYRDVDKGWDGFNASAIRNALISACRIVGIKMTQMKLTVFVDADGYDEDGTPLIRVHGKPNKDIRPVRNDNGSTDLRVRPRWDKWHANLRVRYDADMIAFTDLSNLLMRAGQQVGIGEGRPDSKKSAGIGYGLFDVVGEVPE